MLESELTTLADAAALAVVKAMASDMWSAVRGRVGRLWARRSDKATAMEAVLDEDADLVAGADDAERDDVQADLVPVWRRRLVTLLADCPESERAELVAQLRELVDSADDGAGRDGAQTVSGSVAGRDIIQIRSVGGDFTTGGSDRGPSGA